MVKSTLAVLLTTLSTASAWPAVAEMVSKRDDGVNPGPREPAFKSGRPNTSIPPAPFNAEEQLVDTSDDGPNPFRAPGEGDLRGQCPGLNAAANHGLIPRNGILTTQQTIDGLGGAYGMGADLALFLAVLAIGISGDPITGTWSIGSSFDTTTGLPADGIVGTHNRYEGDASIMKGDAYLHDGNVGFFEIWKFENFYNMGETYTLDNAAAQSDHNTRWSIANNPYYFSAPFAGLVAPAAYDFVINFMSNHSAEAPGGTLDRNVLKSFFAVTGEPGSFVQHRGMERIPTNWYRRPSATPYTIPNVLGDVQVNNLMYPGIVRFGGNTGTTNSFVGVDPQDFTNGAFNAATLADGNNGACFLLQASMQGIPDAAQPLLGLGGSLLNWIEGQVKPLQNKFGCPQLSSFNNQLFNQFPGASYSPAGTK